MKKGLALLLAIVFVCSLAGCGGGESDPNCGVYEGKYGTYGGMSIALDQVVDGGISVELKNGGKAVLRTGGEDYNIKWELEGTDLKLIASDITLEGTLSDGTMVIRDYGGSSFSIYLECAELLPAEDSAK